MRRKVAVLTTGGTIGHRSSESGIAVMDFDPQKLAFDLGFTDPEIDIEFKSVLQKGSMDITPADWQTVAAAASDAISENSDGVVILHGTDTLHYTAAALSFMLRDLGAPVVMTGSMIPGGDIGSDALANLKDAIHLAAFSELAEVCIVFSADDKRQKGVIIRGNRARKIHSTAINAFDSINAPPIGYIQGAKIVYTGLSTHLRKSSKIRLCLDLDPNIALIKLHPGISREMFAQSLQGASGAVLEGTGVGHVRSDLQDIVIGFNRPTAISTQAIYGGERLGLYDVDKGILAIPNIIPVGNMTSETAMVKLMWALKQNGDIKSTMLTDVAGETGEFSLVEDRAR